MSENNNKKPMTDAQRECRTKKRKDRSHANKQVDIKQLAKLREDNENATIVGYTEAQAYGAFEKVFNATILDKRLKGNALKVLLVLCVYHNSKANHKSLTEEEMNLGVSFPTQKLISELSGISINTVNTSIQQLIDLGYLVVKNENNTVSSSNRYIINLVVDKRFSPKEREIEELIKKQNDIQLPF